MGGRAPWPMMYCLSWGSHFFVVLHTQPSNAFVTMQTTPRVCATLMTWITASCTRLMASRTSGRSGRGWPNHAGIWFCQSKSQPPSSTAQCHWSAMWSLRIWRIQLVGQSVSSQSKKMSVRQFGKAPGSGCSVPLIGDCVIFRASGPQITAGGVSGVNDMEVMEARESLDMYFLGSLESLLRRHSSEISIASPRRIRNGPGKAAPAPVKATSAAASSPAASCRASLSDGGCCLQASPSSAARASRGRVPFVSAWQW
mmetsp:Transcript_93696/g.291712  ORF Transcript_93696/g.291712 Transcript_93696/m.291712 type:complete len:256 (-) Transcript_93696:117-884(-)